MATRPVFESKKNVLTTVGMFGKIKRSAQAALDARKRRSISTEQWSGDSVNEINVVKV